jgi:dynein heavy chain
LIKDNYNWIVTCLHPVEEPLVKKRIEEMEAVMLPGIESYTWTDPELIDRFVTTAKNTVDSLYEVVTKIK